MLSCITALSFRFPHVSMSMRDEATGRVMMQSSRMDSMTSSFARYFDMGLKRCARSDCGRFELYLGGRSDNDAFKFVFVNDRPVFATEVQRVVDRTLEKCGNPGVPSGKEALERICTQKMDKMVNYPVYVLLIRCEGATVNTLATASDVVQLPMWDSLKKDLQGYVKKVVSDLENTDNSKDGGRSPDLAADGGIKDGTRDAPETTCSVGEPGKPRSYDSYKMMEIDQRSDELIVSETVKGTTAPTVSDVGDAPLSHECKEVALTDVLVVPECLRELEEPTVAEGKEQECSGGPDFKVETCSVLFECFILFVEFQGLIAMLFE